MPSKPSFRDAWKQSQHCIIPADAIFKPDWRSGRAVPTRTVRADGESMGIAGLWSAWQSPQGERVHSFIMLTINAAQHPLMRLFHKPADDLVLMNQLRFCASSRVGLHLGGGALKGIKCQTGRFNAAQGGEAL